VETGIFVVVFLTCVAGLFALYKVVGISTSGGTAGGIVIVPSSIVALAAQLEVRRRLRKRYAPEELTMSKLKKLGK
jgi:Kef-type K+ transport system membrane component KefB